MKSGCGRSVIGKFRKLSKRFLTFFGESKAVFRKMATNSYTKVPSSGARAKTTVCKQGGTMTPEMWHHNPYPEWSTGVFAKWCEQRKWRQDRLIKTDATSSPKTSEAEKRTKEEERQKRMKNAADPELIKRRKEITDSFVAKSTRNLCKTTEDLIQKLKEMKD